MAIAGLFIPSIRAVLQLHAGNWIFDDQPDEGLQIDRFFRNIDN